MIKPSVNLQELRVCEKIENHKNQCAQLSDFVRVKFGEIGFKSIFSQPLRRRIYRKAKAELAGRGGVADSVKVLPAEQAYSALR